MRVSAQVTGFKEVQKLIKMHPELVKKTTLRSGEKLARRIIDFIVRRWRDHRKTGALEFGNTWQGKKKGKVLSWQIFNQVFYSRFIETGRREVRPGKAKALSWIGPDGKRVFSMRSKATKPDPAYGDAFKRFVIGWHVRLSHELQEAFNKVNRK